MYLYHETTYVNIDLWYAMLLFQRVKEVASVLAGSQTILGEKLGFSSPRTFQAYLTEARQDNLWPLLPKLLEIFPEIRREWLYFGEGAMLTSDAPSEAAAASDWQRRIAELEAELREERALNRRLTERLLEMEK